MARTNVLKIRVDTSETETDLDRVRGKAEALKSVLDDMREMGIELRPVTVEKLPPVPEYHGG